MHQFCVRGEEADRPVPLDPENDHVNPSDVRSAAVFKNKNPLPGAQRHAAGGDRNNLTRPGQGHAQMAGRVVRSFQGVDVIALLGNNRLKIRMEIGAGTGIGIFVDDQAGAGVLNKNGGRACLDSAVPNDPDDFLRDLVGSFA